MVFQFSTDQASRYRGFDAQAIGEALSDLEVAHGALLTRPDVVIAAARDPKSPLHPVFEWNDAKGAEQFRKLQARSLVRAVVRVSALEEVESEVARVARPPRQVPSPSVFGRVRAAQKPDRLTEARRELADLRQRYADLDELTLVFKAIDETLPRLKATA